MSSFHPHFWVENPNFPHISYFDIETDGIKFSCYESALPYVSASIRWVEVFDKNPLIGRLNGGKNAVTSAEIQELASALFPLAEAALRRKVEAQTQDPKNSYFKGTLSPSAQLDADLRAALGDNYYHARQLLLSGLSCYFNDSPRRLLAGFRHQCTAYDYEIKKLDRDRDTLHLRYSLDLVEIFQVLENFRPALEQLDLAQTCGEFAGLHLKRYLADAPADLSEKILAELAKPE